MHNARMFNYTSAIQLHVQMLKHEVWTLWRRQKYLVMDNRESVVLQLGGWAWSKQPITVKDDYVTNHSYEPLTWTDSLDERPKRLVSPSWTPKVTRFTDRASSAQCASESACLCVEPLSSICVWGDVAITGCIRHPRILGSVADKQVDISASCYCSCRCDCG
jgi:hypothetical protein